LFYLITAFFSPRHYAGFFRDDGFNECLTVAAQLLSAGFFFAVFFRLKKLKAKSAWLYLLLSLFCFWVAGEELSWGQRLINLQIPDFFMKYNDNQSLNIHNLYFFAPWEDEITLIFYLAGGLFLPPVLCWASGLRSFFARHNLPFPFAEITLGMTFGLLVEFYAALRLKYYAEFAYEAVELFFALSLLWVAVYNYLKSRELK